MAAMQNYVNFASVLKYSRMYNHILDHCNKDQYSKLFGILLKIIEPVLIDYRHESEIGTLFKQFIFSCFQKYHQCEDQKYTQHFQATAPCLERMYIDLQPEETINKSRKKRKLTSYWKQEKYNTLFQDIPNEILTHSMSFIDPVHLQKLELVSHRFLQCARTPTAIQIVSIKLLRRILFIRCFTIYSDLFHRYSMKRYLVLKDVHISKETLDSVMRRYDHKDVNSVLSWFTLDDQTIQYLYTFNKKLYDGCLNTLNMNVLNGLQYYPISSDTTLSIDIAGASMWDWPLYDAHLIWRRFYQIRKQLERFNDIHISFVMKDYDFSTRFIWFAACCHANIECLGITYFAWNCFTSHSTQLFMESYERIIPELPKLKCLSINCSSDPDNPAASEHVKFVEDGETFLNALLRKIRANTLEELEIINWYKSWCNLNGLSGWILKHYQTMNTLQFRMGIDMDNGCGFDTEIDFEIGSVEIWKPFILLHQIIIDSTKSKELDHWIKNVLRKFEFVIALENPEEFGWSTLEEYLNCFEQRIPELKQAKLNLRITECIRCFIQNGIEWKICVYVGPQLEFKTECDRDPLSIYHDFFLNSKINEYTLEFVDNHQTLITEHFA